MSLPWLLVVQNPRSTSSTGLSPQSGTELFLLSGHSMHMLFLLSVMFFLLLQTLNPHHESRFPLGYTAKDVWGFLFCFLNFVPLLPSLLPGYKLLES